MRIGNQRVFSAGARTALAVLVALTPLFPAHACCCSRESAATAEAEVASSQVESAVDHPIAALPAVVACCQTQAAGETIACEQGSGDSSALTRRLAIPRPHCCTSWGISGSGISGHYPDSPSESCPLCPSCVRNLVPEQAAVLTSMTRAESRDEVSGRAVVSGLDLLLWHHASGRDTCGKPLWALGTDVSSLSSSSHNRQQARLCVWLN